MTNKKIDKIKTQQIKTKNNKKLSDFRKQLDVNYTMDGSVKQLFLNLTKMQIPFNYEKTILKYLHKDIQIDTHGNYFLKIGDTSSMFCCHLDTYCYEYKKVWHVIDGDFISTDGTTTLGGDDKAGAVIMIKMMEANIPGLYYFFRGEEGVTSPTGTWGSRQALKTYKNLFSKYDRCIAFDRKGNDSVITQQMYANCCSVEFANALIENIGDSGLDYIQDDTGMWCDSAVFMDIIPECTNLSVGYVDEHTFMETQNIKHLELLVNACLNIDWENLPTKRDPSITTYAVDNYNTYDDWTHDYNTSKKNNGYNEMREYTTMLEMFQHVVNILNSVGYDSLNNDFSETEEMYFQNYETKDFFGLKIIDFDIFISSDDTLKNYDHIGDLDTFERYVGIDNTQDDEIMNQNQHLDSISSTDVIYDDVNNNKNDNDDFTKEQNDTFKLFVDNNKQLVIEIVEEIKNTNNISVPPKLWITIDNKLSDDGFKLNYGINGINADDFIDWVVYNWEYCFKLSPNSK